MAAIDERPYSGALSCEFEDLAASYRSECAHGVPMSVHERYGRQLRSLRQELRSVRMPCRLGDVLRSMCAVDNEHLAAALARQSASRGEKLLGEILIDLGWASEQTIRHAVELQAEAHREAAASVLGASRD